MGWLNKHQLCVYVCMCVFFITLQPCHHLYCIDMIQRICVASGLIKAIVQKSFSVEEVIHLLLLQLLLD